MQECTCWGRNKNCVFCDGSGFVVNRMMSPQVPSFKIERVPEKELKRGRKMISCPECRQLIWELRLASHRRKVHGVQGEGGG